MYNENIKFEELLRTNTISKLAKEDKSSLFYEEHFIPCANICFEMSYIKNVDKIDAILVGLFHDVGKFLIKGGVNNQAIIGAKYIGEFLRKNKYDESIIQLIKQSIMNHRKNANDDMDRMSKLIINSDIISYIIHKKYFYE